MSSLVLTGDTSGQVTISAPAVAGSNTLTLQAATGTMSVNTLATAVASTSGTSIDFTALPSWIKRITLMFNEVSVSGTSAFLIQLGTGSTTFTTSGYVSTGGSFSSGGTTQTTSTAGMVMFSNTGSTKFSGTMTISNISGNTWVSSHSGKYAASNSSAGGGVIALGAVLTAVRFTTVNGTDTYNAGTVNILYEG